MAKYTGFFDESGDRHISVFAGFVAVNDQWERFESEWREIRDKFNAPPLHMRTFAHSVAEFAEWKGDEKRRQSFLQALIGLIGIRTRTSFATAVLVDDFNEVATRYPELRENHTPFAMAGNSCIVKVARWADRSGIPRSEVGVLFEDGAADRKAFVREAQKHLGITPAFAKKTDYAAFQAADLLAFEYLNSNRRMVAAGDEKLSLNELRKPIQGLLALQPKSAAGQWGIHDKEAIERACLEERRKAGGT